MAHNKQQVYKAQVRLQEFFIVALAQPREDREEDDPMKHRPTALAELRTKSFAATGALVSRSSLYSDTSGLIPCV